MNSKNSSLLRIERALDRVELKLKMIDTRVGQLHAAANFNKKINSGVKKTKETGYFASKSKPVPRTKPTPPTLFGRGDRSNYAKLTINKNRLF